MDAQLMTTYVTKSKGKKPCFAINKEIKTASALYGMDLSNKDKSAIKEIQK